MGGLLGEDEVVALLSDPRSVWTVPRPSGRDVALPFRRQERQMFLGYVAYLREQGRKPSGITLRQRRYVHLGLRDDWGCYLCGVFCPPWDWTLDHLLPRARGGRTYDGNLRQACAPCNGAKGSMTPGEYRLFLAGLVSA